MARISNFLYCLDSEASNNITRINGVLDVIVPDYIPGNFSFSLFFSLYGLKDGKHEINLIFKDPHGNTTAEVLGVLPYKRNDKVEVPPEYSALHVSATLNNVLFESHGLCTTEVFLDGELLDRFDIYVIGKNSLGDDA